MGMDMGHTDPIADTILVDTMIPTVVVMEDMVEITTTMDMEGVTTIVVTTIMDTGTDMEEDTTVTVTTMDTTMVGMEGTMVLMEDMVDTGMHMEDTEDTVDMVVTGMDPMVVV